MHTLMIDFQNDITREKAKIFINTGGKFDKMNKILSNDKN